jgi:hypothetical protein
MAKRKSRSTPKTVKARKATSKRRKAAKRELIDTGTDKRYVKRRADGTFKESDYVSRSLRADRAHKAKTTVKSGYGDQGDQPRKKR